jgi:DNA-binding MarR family transcriptional regulator
MTDETTEVMELLLRVQRAIHRSKVLTGSQPPWIATPSLTMAQLRALMVLDDNRHLTVGQLAERLGIGMPAASSIVDRLVEEGLADRHQDPDDRRRIVVRPSKQGSGRIDTMRQGPKEVLEALVCRLDPGERGHVIVALRALVRAAEDMQAENEDQAATPPATTAAVPAL